MIRPRVRTGGVDVPVSAVTAGTISELLVAADLMARGYVVYFPLMKRTAHVDLIATPSNPDRLPLRIEVRSGTIGARGQVRYAKKADSRADHHAVVMTGEPVHYKPELPSA
jgi:hypothetical protein